MEENSLNDQLQDFISTTFNNLKSIIRTDTVIGEAVMAPDKSLVIPLTKVTFGYLSAGSEVEGKNSKFKNQPHPIAGGGAGLSIKPIGFFVLNGSDKRLFRVDATNEGNDWMDIISSVISKLGE